MAINALYNFEMSSGLPVEPRVGGWIFRNVVVNGDWHSTRVNRNIVPINPAGQAILEMLFSRAGAMVPFDEINVGVIRTVISKVRIEALKAGGPNLFKVEKGVGVKLSLTATERVISYLPGLVMPEQIEEQAFRFGDWVFHTGSRNITYQGLALALPPKVRELLFFLAVNQGRMMPIPQIIEACGINNYRGRGRREVYLNMSILKYEIGNLVTRHFSWRRGVGILFSPDPLDSEA